MLKNRKILVAFTILIALNNMKFISEAKDEIPIEITVPTQRVEPMPTTQTVTETITMPKVTAISMSEVASASATAISISAEPEGVTTSAIEAEPQYMYSKKYMYARDKSGKKKFFISLGDKVKIEKIENDNIKIKKHGEIGFVEKKSLAKTKDKAIKLAEGEDFFVTGYCPCTKCSEGWGRQTSSGRTATADHTIAADLSVLPPYTEVYIEGLGKYVVEDVGGAIKGKHVDVFVDCHEECDSITRHAKVFIIE